MQANDAMRILGSAAAMGLLGGGSALAYNAVSQPTLDEYGNTIESNDINPFVAALGGAAVGAVGGYGVGRWAKNEVRNNLDARGMSAGAAPQPRQSPDIDIDIDWIDPEYQAGESARTRAMEKTRYAQGVNDLREASIPIRQIVPANPMEIQNPMSPPGMKTVVMQQPPKAPGQEMMEDVLRLRELANRQRQERQSVARIDMALNGWGRSPEWQAKYGERMPQNAAGWDVMLPQNSYERNRELTEIDKYLAQKKIG